MQDEGGGLERPKGESLLESWGKSQEVQGPVSIVPGQGDSTNTWQRVGLAGDLTAGEGPLRQTLTGDFCQGREKWGKWQCF